MLSESHFGDLFGLDVSKKSGEKKAWVRPPFERQSIQLGLLLTGIGAHFL